MYGLIKYGQHRYGDVDVIDDGVIESLAIDLMRYLPKHFQSSVIMREIQKGIASELGYVNHYLQDLEKQLSIETATWGLIVYEQELGLNTNNSTTFEDRREIIKAKIRGSGVVTIEMLKNTAEAFSGGEVMVIEKPKEYAFTIQFVGVKGIPRNMQSFINMLEDIKPAHLSYDFKYTYTVWDFIDETWLSVKGKTWNDLRVYEGVI